MNKPNKSKMTYQQKYDDKFLYFAYMRYKDGTRVASQGHYAKSASAALRWFTKQYKNNIDSPLVSMNVIQEWYNKIVYPFTGDADKVLW